MLEVLYASGLRVSELVNLKTFEVNQEAGVLRILGKGSKERLVPLGEEAVDWVLRYQAQWRPALLGLIREVSRLPSAAGDRLTADLAPLVDRAVAYLQHEMDAGRLRQADPRLVASLCYATVTGIATEPEALRVVGWQPSAAGLRRLRNELLAFLRAALAP